MRYVKERELLGYCLQPLGDIGYELLDRWSEEEAVALRSALAQILIDEADQSDLLRVEWSATENLAGQRFDSVIFRDKGKDGTQMMVTFGFRDAAVETALPLLGIAIAVFAGQFGLASALQIAGAAKTLWAKLLVLRRPQDGDAIDVINAILRVRARHLADGRDKYPTGEDLHSELPLAPDLLARALTWLRSKSVVEAVAWGGQRDDDSHLANQWRVKL
jgi:hypothetical protein